LECKSRSRAAICDGKPLEEEIQRKRRRVTIASGTGIDKIPQQESIRLRYDVDMLKKSVSNIEKMLVSFVSQHSSGSLAQHAAETIRGYDLCFLFDNE
jgi:hypothetical protein